MAVLYLYIPATNLQPRHHVHRGDLAPTSPNRRKKNLLHTVRVDLIFPFVFEYVMCSVHICVFFNIRL